VSCLEPSNDEFPQPVRATRHEMRRGSRDAGVALKGARTRRNAAANATLAPEVSTLSSEACVCCLRAARPAVPTRTFGGMPRAGGALSGRDFRTSPSPTARAHVTRCAGTAPGGPNIMVPKKFVHSLFHELYMFGLFVFMELCSGYLC
jgi:hypothetical protein